MDKKLCAIVLAGGRGKRMGKELAKCGIKLGDKTIIERVIENIINSGIEEVVCVLGYRSEEIEPLICERSKICYQEKQLGTADAVKACKNEFEGRVCDVLVVAGDMPFVKSETLKKAYCEYLKEKADLLICTYIKDNSFGYGRIVRKDNKIIDIKEEKDCSEVEKKIIEVNASVYIFDNEKLFKNIDKIKNNNAQNEYYLTDIVSIFKNEGYKIITYNFESEMEIYGINSNSDLERALEKLCD